jgi:Cu/Ag efflux pump CusA
VSDTDETDGRFVRGLKSIYQPTLRLTMRFKRTVMVLALVATVGSLALANTFGTSFLPSFNEGTFTVFLMAPPGTSLEESDRLARGVEKRLTEIEGVRTVVRRTGRAERDEHAEPVSSSEVEVTIKSGFKKNDVRREIDKIISAVPGITTMIGQPIEHRLSHVLSGTPAAISIDVFGDDLDTLRQIAKEVEVAVKSVPGARDVNANREVMITTLPVNYRREDLKRWGLTRASAAEQVHDAVFGQKVASVNEGIRVYDMVVRLQPHQRETVGQLKRLILRGQSGALVRLAEVADIGPERASNLITRQNGQRKAVISCNVGEGTNLGDLVAKVQKVVDPIVVKKYGHSVRYGGQFEAQQSASKTLYVMGGAVVLLMGLLLSMAFGSVRTSLLVLVNLPLAVIGGIVAIYLTESGFGSGKIQTPVISIASMVGFITLFGIAVRNGILLVNHYVYLMDEEGLGLYEAIERGSMERLVPILMTALTAVLGLLPLALAKGEPGSELLSPLAIVILGGLVSSTFLNLVVVPAGYAWLFSKRAGSDEAGDSEVPV